MPERFKNFINGKWEAASDNNTFQQRNPANLEEITGVWPQSPREDAAKAIEAAQKAFPAWSSLSYYERAAYLKKALQEMTASVDETALVITKENGKTLLESKSEINSAIREMDFQINQALQTGGETLPSSEKGVIAYCKRQPLGVVSVISPWNFPFNVPARKCVPALMAGNTVVFKPASLTPHTGKKFLDCFIKACLPEGVLNCVTGGGDTVGDEFTVNPCIKAITFTGSTQVGKKINQKAAGNMARTQLEMGGKNPLVILKDADLEQAAQAAVTAAYACAGQWCTSTSRVIVEKKAASAFIDHLLTLVGSIVVGDGTDQSTTMGPVCGKVQMENILKMIALGQKEGAVLAAGGQCLDKKPFDKGCFIQPTVFTNVKPEMIIAREEIFGPVLSIIEADDFDRAVEIANNVLYGLSSSIFTKDLEKAFKFIDKTKVGLSHVNMLTAWKEPQFSFGGIKDSGFGIPEAGKTGIEFFTEHKTVYVKYG